MAYLHLNGLSDALVDRAMSYGWKPGYGSGGGTLNDQAAAFLRNMFGPTMMPPAAAPAPAPSGRSAVSCIYQVLGVDNVLRDYTAPSHLAQSGTSSQSGGAIMQPVCDFPLVPKPGYNIVIRVGSGAYEYVVAGMPHPDSVRTAAAPAAAPAASPAAAPAARASSVSYSGGYESGGAGTLVRNSVSTKEPEAAQSGGGGLLVALAAAAALFFSGS